MSDLVQLHAVGVHAVAEFFATTSGAPIIFDRLRLERRDAFPRRMNFGHGRVAARTHVSRRVRHAAPNKKLSANSNVEVVERVLWKLCREPGHSLRLDSGTGHWIPDEEKVFSESIVERVIAGFEGTRGGRQEAEVREYAAAPALFHSKDDYIAASKRLIAHKAFSPIDAGDGE